MDYGGRTRKARKTRQSPVQEMDSPRLYACSRSGGLIDYKDVISWFDEQQQNGLYPYKIGYDPYCASYMAQEMKQKYGENTLQVVRQGAKTLSIPLEQLRQLLKSKTIRC